MTCVCVLALWGGWANVVHAQRIGIGIGIGVPGPYYGRPYGYGYYPYYPYGYYRPYPVVVGVGVAPPPVVVQPAPVVVQQPAQVPVTSASPPSSAEMLAAPVARGANPAPSPSPADDATITQYLQKLSSGDDQVRCDAVEKLGKMLTDRAVDPLTAVLAGDRSAIVREAAARSLGLIGAPRALPALIRAAQADSDRDVRRSAQFTVELIHSRLKQ